MRNLMAVVAVAFLCSGISSAEDNKAAEKPIVGGLDNSIIDEYIAKYIPQIRTCYTKELEKSKGLAGRVSVKFNIGPDGKVTQATAEESTLGNAAAEACILGVVKGIEFPAPAGGGNVEVSYPFAFTADKKGEASPKKAAKHK